MDKNKLMETINLIQGTYRFLYLSLFLEDIIKNNNIGQFAKDITIKTGPKSSFKLKGTTIKKLIEEIYSNPNKPNIFGYLSQTFVFKEIFSLVRELLEDNNSFQKFLKNILKDKYFDFEQTIRFLRNVFSHSISLYAKIKIKDFEKQKIFLLQNNKPTIKFNFNYSKALPTIWKGSKTYGLNIKINFKNIIDGQKITDIIPLHNLFLLCEFCYNMCEIWKKTTNNM